MTPIFCSLPKLQSFLFHSHRNKTVQNCLGCSKNEKLSTSFMFVPTAPFIRCCRMTRPYRKCTSFSPFAPFNFHYCSLWIRPDLNLLLSCHWFFRCNIQTNTWHLITGLCLNTLYEPALLLSQCLPCCYQIWICKSGTQCSVSEARRAMLSCRLHWFFSWHRKTDAKDFNRSIKSFSSLPLTPWRKKKREKDLVRSKYTAPNMYFEIGQNIWFRCLA